MSPMNFRFAAHGPTRAPKMIPATVAIRICVVKDTLNFFFSITKLLIIVLEIIAFL